MNTDLHLRNLTVCANSNSKRGICLINILKHSHFMKLFFYCHF